MSDFLMKGKVVGIKTIWALVLSLFAINTYATTYYVNENGNDSASGTTELTAWKSLNKVSSMKYKPGDQILFNRGNVFHGTLIITSSGTSTNNITYGAYGSGAKPVISGFETLSNWESLGNQIYRTTSSCKKDVNLLVINNEMHSIGRYPNDSYLSYESVNGTTSITDNQLTSSPNWTGAEVVIKKNGWTIDRNQILNHSASTIYYQNQTGYKPRMGSQYGYFIQRDLKTLDKFGEWYFDGTYMYMYSGSDPNDNLNVKTTTQDYLLYSYRKGDITIKDMSFEGSNKYSVFVDFADLKPTFTLIGCDINFSGTEGVLIQGYSDGVNVIDNNITNTQGQALSIGSHGTLYNTKVSGNKIINTGMKPGMGNISYGAVMVKGFNSLIEYNEIDMVGQNGISYHLSGTVVRYNLVKEFNYLIHDGGGIYTWVEDDINTFTSGMKVYNNIILSGEDGNGVYTDGFSNNVEIFNNTIAYLRAGYGILISEPRYNNVHHNTIFDNSQHQIAIHNLSETVKAANNKVNNNIVVGTTSHPEVMKIYDDLNSAILNFGVSDNNIFIAPYIGAKMFHIRTNSPWIQNDYTFSDYQKRNFDLNSRIVYSNEPELHYNASKTIKTITLPNAMIDVNGNKYTNSISIQPYTSIVLYPDPDPTIPPKTNQSPILTDQTIQFGSVVSGELLGTILATDPDAEQKLTFEITFGNESKHFGLNSTNGNLYTVQEYNGTDNLSGTLTVKVSDNGAPSLSKTATVTIIHSPNDGGGYETNSAPVINNQIFNVQDVLPGDLIGKVLAYDPDTNQDLNYEILSGNESSYFGLSSTSGNLYAIQQYNSIDNLSSTLTIKVSDNGIPEKSSIATITVIHNNELPAETNSAPQINDQTFEVSNIVPGSYISTILASDINTTQDLTFNILSGNENTNFGLSSKTGNLYVSTTYTSGEDISSILRVQVTDNGDPIKSAIANIQIIDANFKEPEITNNAPVVSSQTFNINGIGPGSFIGSITASDPDDGQALQYKIVSGNELNMFGLSASSGNLYASTTYKSEQDISGVLIIEVTDNGSPQRSATASLTINQIHSNIAPTINDQQFDVITIQPGGYIGKIIASDENSEQKLSYHIISGNDNNNFGLSSSTGNLYASTLYVEGDNINSRLTVQVTDNGVPSKTSTAILTINHIESNTAPLVANQTMKVSSIVPGGFVGKIIATDEDLDQQLKYRIVAGNESNNFGLSESTGNLYTSTIYKAGNDITASLTVEVSDDGNPSKSTLATINVEHTINNIAPIINDQNLIVGNLSAGGFIGKIIAHDPDREQVLTFRIISGNESSNFGLTQLSGNLYASTTYTPGEDISSELIIEIEDNGTPSMKSTARVSVQQTLEKSKHMEEGNTETSLANDNILKVNVFPTPFNNSLNIDISGIQEDIVDIIVLDISGSIVFQKHYTNASDWIRDRYSLEKLAKGHYVIKIISGQQVVAKRVIKS